MTKEGLNTSILASLRDTRFKSFQDSLLGTVKSSLCKGLISFDCYPNFTIYLNDKKFKSLISQIQTHNYGMIERSIMVVLIFRVNYKAMISAFKTKHRFHNKKGETLLFQMDLSISNKIIPYPIEWNQITLLDEWLLERLTQSKSENLIPKQNTHLIDITQYSGGSVQIRFDRYISSRYSSAFSSEIIDLGRVPN